MGRVMTPNRTIIVPDDARVLTISELLKRVDGGESVMGIARDLGLSYQAISYHLKRHGYAYNHAARSWARA